MRKLAAIFIIIALSRSARADAAAVVSTATKFRQRCVDAIPASQSGDRGALGHIPAHRFAVLDGEIAVLDALRLQLDWAKTQQKEDVTRYCSEFAVSSLDALKHEIDECAETLKICGISVAGEIVQSRAEALEAIENYRSELSTEGRELKKG